MKDSEYKRIFSNNLKYYMNLHGKNQVDLMKDLGLSSSTLSNWCTGEKLPRMDKVQMLADYFHISKSDLIEEKPDPDPESEVDLSLYLADDELHIVKTFRMLDEARQVYVIKTVDFAYDDYQKELAAEEDAENKIG